MTEYCVICGELFLGVVCFPYNPQGYAHPDCAKKIDCTTCRNHKTEICERCVVNRKKRIVF